MSPPSEQDPRRHPDPSWIPPGKYRFDPAPYEEDLVAVLAELAASLEGSAAGGVWQPPDDGHDRELDRILRRHPKDGRGFFSKSELVRGVRHLARSRPEALAAPAEELLARLRTKPVRSLSGVAVVTVLTRPFPCPGRCVFCPNDVRMPKSYLSDEPGCQRAATHRFDPFAQTWARLLALHRTGHCWQKVELMILGGTWSFYPEGYRVWFVQRCFEAMNGFGRAAEAGRPGWPQGSPADPSRPPSPRETVDGRRLGRGGAGEVGGGDPGGSRTYNQILGRGPWSRVPPEEETSTWEELAAVQRENETAAARCVGLVVETRPDHLDGAEVARNRSLGVTRVQIGLQSLSDEVLAANRRGHDVAASRRAMALLRRAGFKVMAHWMPNLVGSSPGADREDFDHLFEDPAFRPDELKVYPCALVETAELMRYWEAGAWRPYEAGELMEVLVHAVAATPPWCRLTRVVRDIPGTDIVAGNEVTNFRQAVEQEVERRALPRRDVRSREIRGQAVEGEVRLEELRYATAAHDELGGTEEVFLQWVDGAERLLGFLRLSLPEAETRCHPNGCGVDEIREVADFSGVFVDDNASPSTCHPNGCGPAEIQGDPHGGGLPAELGELEGSAVIREVHVYGAVVGLGEEGEAAQHRGLGTRLVERAAQLAREAGFRRLAVISSVGTREWYRRLGFGDGELYQHLEL